jgi:hypothetical protein
MFKNDTMEQYVADSLKAQAEAEMEPFDFFRSSEAEVILFVGHA